MTAAREHTAGRDDVLERSPRGDLRLRDVFDSMELAFQLCEVIPSNDDEVDFVFVEVNSAFERQSAMPRDSLVGRRLREVFPDPDRRLLETYARVARTGVAQQQESFNSAQGRCYDVHVFSPSTGTFAAISHDVTDRRRAEEARQERESSLRHTRDHLIETLERYRLVGIATREVIFDWDLTSDSVKVNEAIEHAYGYPFDEVPGAVSWWFDRIHPEDRPRVAETVRGAVDDPAKSCWFAEFRFQHQDGHWVEVLDRGYVVRDAHGRGLRLIGSMLDLTEWKRTEETLRRSTEEFRRLADSMPQLVWMLGPNGDAEYFNQLWIAYTGITIEGSRGEGWMSVLHPDDRERVRERTSRCFATGEIYEVEHRMRSANDGKYRWFLARALPVRDAAGRVVRWFGTCTDIDDQKRATEAVQQSRDTLQAVLDSAPAGVVVADAVGQVLMASTATERILGAPVTKDAHQSHDGYHLCYPDGSPIPRGSLPLSLALRGETVTDTEILVVRADGARATVVVSATPIRASDGTVRGGVKVFQDITDRKRAEREIEDAKARLERNEQALLAANEVLREREARLRDVDRRKNEFLGMLSHELRNPLSPILNSVYILERAVPGGEQAQRAQQVIARQARHLARLIDDLLDVTRIARGKLTLQRERLDLTALAWRTAEDHREVFETNGIKLEVCSGEQALFVDGDPTRLAQVIGNLLQNAAKFTPRGGRVTLEVESTSDAVAVVRVRDTGVGMQPDTLEHMFKPFVQADLTVDRSRGGLGLGLALAKGLVEVHAGRIEARSSGIGRGSEFSVFLPLADDARR